MTVKVRIKITVVMPKANPGLEMAGVRRAVVMVVDQVPPGAKTQVSKAKQVALKVETRLAGLDIPMPGRAVTRVESVLVRNLVGPETVSD